MKKFNEYITEDMITSVIQKGNQILIYNASGRIIGTIIGGILLSFTPTNVSVSKNGITYIYNSSGRQVSAIM